MDVSILGEAAATKMELSQPSVRVVGSYDARGQSQPTLRVDGIIAGGAAGNHRPASEKCCFFLMDAKLSVSSSDIL